MKHAPRRRLVPVILILLAGFLPAALGGPLPVQAAGTISLTALDTAYSQDFDTLANAGSANTAVPTGWDFFESGANANGAYRAGDGSLTTGDTYSFGATGSTERAFGGLFSNALLPTIGAQFTNNTGGTITSLAVTYTGEQWRLGTTGRVHHHRPEHRQRRILLDSLERRQRQRRGRRSLGGRFLSDCPRRNRV